MHCSMFLNSSFFFFFLIRMCLNSSYACVLQFKVFLLYGTMFMDA